MLKNPQKFRNVAIFGSTSEIGTKIIQQLKNHGLENLYIFGRDETCIDNFNKFVPNTKFFYLDVEAPNFQDKLINNLNEIPTLELGVIAIGFLPNENLDLEIESVHRTLTVNAVGSTVVLSSLANKMLNQEFGQILFISSVASMRPRLKNFSYGSSKKVGDFFAEGLQQKYKKSGLKINILRPGYVFTKMSQNFDPAPFAINSDLAAKVAMDGLIKNKQIIYAPKILRILMNIVVRIPRKVFNRLD